MRSAPEASLKTHLYLDLGAPSTFLTNGSAARMRSEKPRIMSKPQNWLSKSWARSINCLAVSTSDPADAPAASAPPPAAPCGAAAAASEATSEATDAKGLGHDGAPFVCGVAGNSALPGVLGTDGDGVAGAGSAPALAIAPSWAVGAGGYIAPALASAAIAFASGPVVFVAWWPCCLPILRSC